MKARLFALVLCCTPLAVAAQDVEVTSASVRDEVDRATAVVVDSLFAALRARDADRLMRLYARGASVLHVSGTQIIQTDTTFRTRREDWQRSRASRPRGRRILFRCCPQMSPSARFE